MHKYKLLFCFFLISLLSVSSYCKSQAMTTLHRTKPLNNPAHAYLNERKSTIENKIQIKASNSSKGSRGSKRRGNHDVEEEDDNGRNAILCQIINTGYEMGSGISTGLAHIPTPTQISTVGTLSVIATTLDKFNEKILGPWLRSIDQAYTHNLTMENINFYAPHFHQRFIGITFFDFRKDNSKKQITVLYPDGLKVLWTLRHGEQLKMNRAGTIVDLTPDEEDWEQKNIFYVTDQMLAEANIGVALNNNYTYYLTYKHPDERPIYGSLLDEICKTKGVNIYHPSYFSNSHQYAQALLNDEEREYVTLHTKLTNKENLMAYLAQDPKAQQDFKAKYGEVLSNAPSLEAAISLREHYGEKNRFKIIPLHKGSNKVLLQVSDPSKQAFKYFSAGHRNDTYMNYTDFPTVNGICELTFTGQKDIYDQYSFELKDKNGRLLTDTATFTFDFNNDFIKNWLIEWYPGLEHEKHIHDLTPLLSNGIHRNLIIKRADGMVLSNCWFQVRGYDYYAGADAKPVTGFKTIKGKTYYFDKDKCSAYSKAIMTIDDEDYYFNPKGIMTDFLKIEDMFYFYSDNNRLHPENVKEIQEHIAPIMLMEMNEINNTYTGTIYSKKLDALVSFNNGTIDAVLIKGQCHSLGVIGWKNMGDLLWFYFDDEGIRATEWRKIDGYRFYFNEDGIMQVGLQNIKNNIYYFHETEGKMETGWKTINGKQYYFSDSGPAKIGYFTGTFEYNFPHYGYWNYYAREDGSIYQNIDRIRLPLSNGKAVYFKFNAKGHAKRLRNEQE